MANVPMKKTYVFLLFNLLDKPLLFPGKGFVPLPYRVCLKADLRQRTGQPLNKRTPICHDAPLVVKRRPDKPRHLRTQHGSTGTAQSKAKSGSELAGPLGDGGT